MLYSVSMYVHECVCACMYAFMSVCCCVSVCVRGYVTTCTCLHIYLLHVLVHILTTCTCLHTHYMYLSTGVQSEVISTDPKISPVNDQPSVYGELTHSGQMVQTYNC